VEIIDKRRSDRVELELRIQLAGVDAAGRNFAEQTRTLVVGRHGAKVVSEHVLLPQQALALRCYRTGLETLARVVGQIGQEGDHTCYGLGIADPQVNVWGIEFPPLEEADRAAGRVLLECLSCGLREVTHLDTFALEVLVANQCLIRPCQQCIDRRVSAWKQVSLQDAKELDRPQALPPAPNPNTSKQVCISLATEVCVRHHQLGNEVALTETVWCGGFRFKSHRQYGIGAVVEAALPFAREGASVFSRVRIVGIEELRSEGTFAYSVAYVPAENALPAGKSLARGAG
jgi:hypothetical protein